MRDENQKFKRLTKEFIKIGSPLNYPIYDKSGNLLIPEGLIVNTDDELDTLYERGLYLDLESSKKIGLIKKRDVSSYVNDEVKDEEDLLPNNISADNFSLKSIKIGEVFQLSQQGDAEGNRKLTAKFMGGIDKKSIICTVPVVNDKTMFIKQFTGFFVQFFSGTNVYQFSTVVDAVGSRPYSYMHLMFPKEISVKRIRKNERVKVNIVVSMRNLTAGTRFNEIQAGRFLDLSTGGALVESYKVGLQVGDVVECSFKVTLEKQDVLLTVNGTVINFLATQSSDGKNIYCYSLQFSEIPFYEKILLQNLIFKQIASESS